MVDLAYWSDFDTSRRDAASAFATLSMNGEYSEHCRRIHLLSSLAPALQTPLSLKK